MTTLREKMKQEMTLRGFSIGTQKNYLRAVVALYKYYNRSPAKLTETEVKSFLLQIISDRKLAPSTYNVIIHGLNFFYEIVLNKKKPDICLPKLKNHQKLPDILSPVEIEKIIKATLNLKYRTMLIIAYGAGLRASEIVKLRVKDIDSTRMVIHIRDSKRNKDRYVILSPIMLKALRIYWKKCRSKKKKNKKNEDELIFPGKKGQSMSQASLTFHYKKAKQFAGITKRGGIHALRHAFATHALECGANLYTIKQLLGHSSVVTTARYLRMTPKALQLTQSPVDQLDI